MMRLASAGGIAGRRLPKGSGEDTASVSHLDLLSVSEAAVLTLFGRERAAILRTDDDPMQAETRKEYKQRSLQAKEMIANGQAVPTGFCKVSLFWSFQYHRDGLLHKSPMSIRDLEYWAWLYGRWAINKPGDMSNGGEFRDVLVSADSIAQRLAAVLNNAARGTGASVPSLLRNEFAHVMQRYSTIRLDYVRDLCTDGLADFALAAVHDDYRKIRDSYAQDCATLAAFLSAVEAQLATQSASRGSSEAREDYCARAFVAFATAFISSLRGGAAPLPTNPLDAPPSQSAGTTSVPLYTTANLPSANAGGAALPPPATPWQPPPPPAYTTIQQPAFTTLVQQHPASGMFSLDSMVRQTAAGYRAPGPLRGPGGGAAEGTDLALAARRVLWAHQLLSGLRDHGPLVAVPPDSDLPALSSYPMPLGPPTPGAAIGTPPALPFAPFGGPAPRAEGAGPRPPARERNYDELAIPFSYTMLGSFSPYKSYKPSGPCFECGRNDGHFALECPVRFVRVKGEAPPGWRSEGPGRAVKNAAEWSADLAELTDAARLQYRAFGNRFPLQPANMYPMTIDDIVAAAPPPPRRPNHTHPRGAGGGRP